MEARDPETYGGDAERLQAEIAALPGVRAVRAVMAPSGRIAEVHVVAEGGKSAKQLVRDVQTVALAKLGLQIDYRTVSVVHFGEQPIPDGAKARPEVGSMSWRTERGRSTFRIELEVGHDPATGEASGGTSSDDRLRLPAVATIEALREGLDDVRELDVADVSMIDVAGRRVAVAAVLRVTGNSEELLIGSAIVRSDESEAVARAVLDAVNRRLYGG